jgi:hypothetical protein
VLNTRIGGYSEDNGPLPAQFSAVDQTSQVIRLGSDMRYASLSGVRWQWV